jgi:hypothetical protein
MRMQRRSAASDGLSLMLAADLFSLIGRVRVEQWHPVLVAVLLLWQVALLLLSSGRPCCFVVVPFFCLTLSMLSGLLGQPKVGGM